MNYEEYENNTTCFWDRIKFYIFIKLAQSLWVYTIIHADYWKRPYGMSFTGSRDFIKKLKYDLADVDDDLEVEMKKQD